MRYLLIICDKMKINLGIARALGIRVAQIEAYLAMMLSWIGVPVNKWSVSVMISVGILWILVDYRWCWSQEQSFSLNNNPEFQRRIDELAKELKEIKKMCAPLLVFRYFPVLPPKENDN